MRAMHRHILIMGFIATSAPMAILGCNGDDDNSGYAVDAGPKVFGNEPVDSGPKDATTDGTLSDADTDAGDAAPADASDAAPSDGSADAADSGVDPCATAGGDAGVTRHALPWSFAVSSVALNGGKGQIITVKKCDSIQWTNGDAVNHTVKSTTAPFDTGSFGGGAASAIVQLKTAGTFHYECGIHGATMSGEVTVTQ
jgi:hypothetical protein